MGETFINQTLNNLTEKDKKKMKNAILPEIEKLIEKSILATRPSDKSISMFLEYVSTTPQLKNSLLEFEAYDPLVLTCFISHFISSISFLFLIVAGTCV